MSPGLSSAIRALVPFKVSLSIPDRSILVQLPIYKQGYRSSLLLGSMGSHYTTANEITTRTEVMRGGVFFVSCFLGDQVRASTVFGAAPVVDDALTVIQSSVYIREVAPAVTGDVGPVLDRFLTADVLLLSTCSDLL